MLPIVLQLVLVDFNRVQSKHVEKMTNLSVQITKKENKKWGRVLVLQGWV